MEAMTAVRQMMVGISQPSSTHDARKISLDADNLIVERCLAGEEAAWEDLVRVHTRRVYAICYRFTGSDHKAQDLTQEVFLRVFRSLKNFRAGEGSFTVWLGRVARNLLIDDYRKNKLDRATDSLEERLPVIENTTADYRARRRNAGRPRSQRDAASRAAKAIARVAGDRDSAGS